MSGPISACPLVPDSITVTGHGAATGTPDIVVLNAGAEVVDESVGRAFVDATAAVRDMLAAVRAAGVDSADIQTKNASVNAHWREVSGTHVQQFRATQDFTVRLRDIDAAGEIVGPVVAAGGEAARLHGMSLGFSDVAELTAAAREAAWRDALMKAEQYAELAGRQLGAVHRIGAVTGSAFARLESGSARRSAQMDMAMAVEPGESEISTTVEVEWALVD